VNFNDESLRYENCEEYTAIDYSNECCNVSYYIAWRGGYSAG